MKVVINECYGGFSLSPLAALTLFEEGWKELGTPIEEYFGKETPERRASAFGSIAKLKKWQAALAQNNFDSILEPFSGDGKFVINIYPENSPQIRSDPRLVEIVERMGRAANGPFAEMVIVEIPDGINWHIKERGGMEHIVEDGRAWW